MSGRFIIDVDGQRWFKEEVTPEIGHALRIDRTLYEGEIDHQHLIVFENQRFGRLFALEGFVQISTADEFIYHEMLVHVPFFAHGRAKRVLIIGGGDGGAIREVLRHRTVEQVTLVEIEKAVVDFSKEWFPSLSAGAFDDPRLDLRIADGAAFVKEDQEPYDVILVDSTDPVGPGKVLFTEEFYRDCYARLGDEGIMVTQCGLPFLQAPELKTAYENQSASFAAPRFYTIAVPAYSGGLMALGFARKGGEDPSPADLAARIEKADLGTFKVYSAKTHQGAFMGPAYIDTILKTGQFG
ncbi:spermidine synthase [Parvularcula bermudensis HTCC2503]|uniref:Polyamine aminopropyltransferase n=1 Tax=Parvularcula bermudensis (strain ATCC BAA-594 / HTCC2503 / KCTC 12087) TaxID=314260 RepID=E0TIA8_PARBH|nr:polyamine aminopropyltransferase [Parvularcula bermudensis]ADM09692.1 spermidine synthase [Parvularcula bermudensis HTCC2503]